MRTQIDYEKSIQKHRLTFKMTTELFMTRLLDNTLWLIFIISTILLLTNKDNYSTNKSVLFLLAVVVLTTWLVIGLVFINKLVVIKGSNMSDNRRKIIQLLNDKFPKLKLDDSGQKIIRYNLKTGAFNWGKRITVIFKDNNMFLNITTLGRYDIKSPFHAVIHYWTLKAIKRQFQNNNNSR